QRSLMLGDEHVGKEIYVTATYTDTFGQSIVVSTRVIVVDTVAPYQPIVLVPEATDGINATEASNGVDVEVILPSNAIAGDVITVSIDGSTPVSHTVTQDDIDAGTPITVTLPKIDIDAAGQGTATITTTYTDPSGNASTPVTTLVNIDTVIPGIGVGATPPSVSVPEATDGINATEASDGIAVLVTLPSDAVEGDVITVSIDGSTPVTHTVTQGDIDAGTPLTVTLPQADITGAGQGDATITTTYTDPSGNAITPIKTNVTIDTVVPSSVLSDLIIQSVLDDQGDVTGQLVSGDTTDDAKPEFSGIAEANSTVSVYDNGTKIGETGADVNGNWSFIPTNPLLLGSHSVTITATDASGNISNPSSAFDFTLLGTASPSAPAITRADDNVDPIQGTIVKDTGVTNDTMPSFSGTAQAGLTVKLYDGATLIGTDIADGNGDWNIVSTVLLGDGVHNIVATASNAAGNVSPQSGAYTFRVDTLAPNVVGTAGTSFELIDNVAPVIGSIGDGSITDDATPTITGTAEAGAIIQAFDGIGNPIGSPVVAAGNGTWTINLSTPLADGSHAISVTATDAAGNTSAPSTPIAFIVDTSGVTAPIIIKYADDVSPVTGDFASGSTTNDTIPTFSGTGESGTTVQLFINGLSAGTPVLVSGGVWTVTDAMLPSEGTHSVVAVSTNAAGANTSSSAFIVTLDTQAPGFGGVGAPVITNIIDDVGIYQGSTASGARSDDTTPTLRGTAEALSVITVTDSVGGTLGTTTTDASGNWTFTPATPLTANTTHNFTVTASDSAGNVSGVSNTYSLIIDTIAPSSLLSELSITSVLDDQGSVQGALDSGDTTDDAKPEFSGKAEANALVTVFDNGIEIGTAQADSNGDWSFTPATPLIAGDHSIQIKATDAAGNVSNPSTPPFAFTLIGAAAPAAPAIVSVEDNVGAIQTPVVKDGSTDDTTPTFNGTAEAGATVTLFEGTTQLGQTVANADGEWTITTSTLAHGDHAIYATATNAAGNVSPQTGTYDFTVDTLAPTTPLINVIETDDVINAAEASDGVTISGIAEAFSTVKLYDGVNFLTSVTADVNGDWSVSFSSSQVPVDGTRNVRATATDEAGNVSTAAVRVVTIETQAPNPPTINIIEGDDIINFAERSDGVVLSGTAEAGTSVKLTYNGADLGTAPVNASGNWSLSFTAGQVPADGFATVVATATDAAGNVSLPTSRTVRIDTVAPVTPTLIAYDNVDGGSSDIGYIANSDTTNDAFPTLSGTGEAGSTIKIFDGATQIGQTTVATNGTWTLELSDPLSNATHTLTVSSTDSAGNSATSLPLNFTVDASTVTAPTISSYFDDVPTTTGDFGTGSATNDTRPTFSGTTPAGTSVEVFVDTIFIGSALVATDGTWSITPALPLGAGAHTVYAVATNSANSTSQSANFTFSIDNAAPAATTIDDIETDNVIDAAEKEDGVTISGTAEAGSIVKLYNNTVYLGEVVANGSGIWSVTFDAGQVPVDGNYRVVATATDSVGNVSLETEKFVRIDTLAPTQPTINTVEGDNIINAVEKSDGVVISGTAEAGSSVAVTFGGVTKTVVATGGVWSASYAVGEVPADGTHTVSVVATDSAGNASIPATQIVRVDTAVPTVPEISDIIDDVGSIQGSTPSGASSDDTTPTLVGTAEAGSTVRIFDGINLLGITTANSSGDWTFTPATALNNGTHSFVVTATDTAGNVSDPSNNYVLTIDTIAPSTPTGSLSYEDNIGTIQSTTSTAPTTDDTRPGVNVGTSLSGTPKLYVDGVFVAADYDSVRGTLTPVTPLVNGQTYSLTYTLTDAAGNESGKSPALVLTIDTSAPAQPTAPLDYEDNIGAIQNATSTAPMTDDNQPGINVGTGLSDTPKLYVDGVAVAANYNATTGTLTPTTPLVEGLHTFSYTLTDAAGNESLQSPALPITIDTSIPAQPLITTLSDNDPDKVGDFTSGVITDDVTPLINGTTVAGTTVQVYDNGIFLGNATVTGSTWSYAMSGLADASSHTITATATNAAGTVSTLSDAFSFLVDTTAPGEGGSVGMPVITSVEDDVAPLTGTVSNNGFTNDTTPTLKGTAEAGSIIKVYDGSTLLGQTTTNGTGSWSFTHTGASNGTTYTYHVTATDQAGNVSANSNIYAITIDTIAPSSLPANLAITGIFDDIGDIQGPINIADANPDTTDDAKPTLSGIAEAGSTVTVYDGITVLGTTTATETGTWTFTPSTPLIAGTHSFTITATDSAGNVSSPSSPAVVLETIGSGAPVAPVILNAIDDFGVIVGNIAKDTGVTDDTNPEIKGTAEAGATVSVFADASLVATVVADSAGNWSVSTSTLGTGVHAITATATNAAGNTSVPTGPYSFTVDTSALAPSFTLQDNSGTTIGAGTDDATPTLVGAAGSAEAGATVIAYDDTDGVGGSAPVEIGRTTAAADGSWSITPTVSLANGTHSITATQTDIAGNTSVPSSASSFTLITNLAVPVINTLTDNVAPLEGTFASGVSTNDAQPTLNGTAPSGALVTIYEGAIVLGTVTADGSGNWSLELPAVLAVGAHSLTATATVVTVESPRSGAFNLTIDTAAPSGAGAPVIASIIDDVGSIQGTRSSGETTDDITPTLVGTAEAGSTVHIYDSVGGLLGTTSANSSGAWTFTPASALTEVTHTLHVTATDAAGNVSSDSNDYSITIDVTPPTLTVNAPDAIYDDTPTISGTTDAANGTTVSITVTQGASTQTFNATVSGGMYSADVGTALVEGTYTVSATVSDVAGNPTTVSDTGSVLINIAPDAVNDTNLVANDAPYSIYSGLFRFYDTMLGREPDIGGYNYYINQLQAGTITPEGVAQAFLDGSEIDFASMSDATFVTVLVTNAYDRAPTPTEQSAFEAQLASMGRVNFSMMISESPESVLVHSDAFYQFAVANSPSNPTTLPASEVFVSAEDNDVTIPVGRLLANDTDVDGDTLTLVSVQGAFGGTVSLAGGVITFVPTLNYSGAASFTYTVSDGQGGSDTASFAWTIAAVNDAPSIVFADINGSVAGEITVDEAAMPSGNNSTSTEESTTGTFVISDVEGLASITLGGTLVTAANVGNGTQYAVANGYMTIDSFNASTGVVGYTYTLTSGASGDNAVVPVVVTVTDSDGLSTTGTLDVRVLDDAPVISASTLTFTPSAINTNLMVTLDLSGSMAWTPNDGNPPNSEGEVTNLELAKQALFNLISKYDSLGDVKVMLVIFGDNASSLSAWVTPDEAKQIMATLEANMGGTNYDTALSEAMATFGDPGKLTGSDVQNVSYFLSDGVPNGGNANYATDTGSTWTNFLSANNILSHAIGINAAAMNNIAYDGITDTNINATQISSLADLDSTLAATVPLLPLVGNVSGSFSSTYGGDGGYVKSFVADGITYTYNYQADGTGTITVTGGAPINYSFNDATNTISFVTTLGSNVSVDMDSGAASFAAPAVVSTAYTESFTYTTTDMDGDTASSTATINVPVTAAPIEVNLIGGFGNQALTGGSSNDLLQGSAGNDSLSGSGGNDILIGAAGSDALTGGTGQDIFVYSPIDTSSTGGIATDTITDFYTDKDTIFEANEDVIDLSGFFSNQGIAVNASNIGDYVNMNGTSLQIDYNGPGFFGSHSWSTIATLSGSSTTFSDADLANMIAAGQIVL
ncbi:MAG: hypothetical protein B7Y23_00800, partial [Sulfurovum sp. 16-42-52]